MFLLFFLLIAMGMLSVLWIVFPTQGASPPDPPPRPVPFVSKAVSAPSTSIDGGPAAAGAEAESGRVSAASMAEPAPASRDSAGGPATTAGVPDPGAGGTRPLEPPTPGSGGAAAGWPPASSPATPPQILDVEDLRRTLEQLLNPAPPKR